MSHKFYFFNELECTCKTFIMILTFPIDNMQITIDKIETLVKFIILKFHKSLKFVLATFEYL